MAFVEPLVQVGLIGVQQCDAVGGLGQQLVQVGGAGEAAHGVPVQPQGAGDRGDGVAVGELFLDGCVTLPGAYHHSGVGMGRWLRVLAGDGGAAIAVVGVADGRLSSSNTALSARQV